MFKRITQLLLLLALLAGFAIASVPAFGARVCTCYRGSGDRFISLPAGGGCKYDVKAAQCVNTSCPGTCY